MKKFNDNGYIHNEWRNWNVWTIMNEEIVDNKWENLMRTVTWTTTT